MRTRPPLRIVAILFAVFATMQAGPSLAEPVAPAGRADYRALIEQESGRAGVPAEIAEAVLAVESGYNPGARGAAGEVGLMQVMPGTARMLGFAGSNDQLANPATNIRYGVTYLARAWRLAGQDVCTAAMKYRAGHGETRFSQLSVSYCLAIRGKLVARGYAVTGSVPAATFGLAGPRVSGGRARLAHGGCRGFCLKGSAGGGAEIDALNARLSSLVISVKIIRPAR